MVEALSRPIRSLTTADWEAGAVDVVVEDGEEWVAGEVEVTTAAPCSPSGTFRWS